MKVCEARGRSGWAPAAWEPLKRQHRPGRGIVLAGGEELIMQAEES